MEKVTKIIIIMICQWMVFSCTAFAWESATKEKVYFLVHRELPWGGNSLNCQFYDSYINLNNNLLEQSKKYLISESAEIQWTEKIQSIVELMNLIKKLENSTLILKQPKTVSDQPINIYRGILHGANSDKYLKVYAEFGSEKYILSNESEALKLVEFADLNCPRIKF